MTSHSSPLILPPSSVVVIKLDVIHILNEIHNNPGFSDLGHLLTPQGLVGFLFALPPSPGSEGIFSVLEHLHPTVQSREIFVPDTFQILCEQVVEEIDLTVGLIGKSNNLTGTSYFNGWEDLSCLKLMTLKEDLNGLRNQYETELQKLAWSNALASRLYDGLPEHIVVPF